MNFFQDVVSSLNEKSLIELRSGFFPNFFKSINLPESIELLRPMYLHYFLKWLSSD